MNNHETKPEAGRAKIMVKRLVIFLSGMYWRVYIARLSVRWVKRFNLGNEVEYKGKVWTLYQGVASPRWKLFRGDHPEREFCDAMEKDMKKVFSFKNYFGSFKSGYRFYMQNWYGIWLRDGIKPWMRGCRIWGR